MKRTLIVILTLFIILFLDACGINDNVLNETNIGDDSNIVTADN